MRERSDGEAAHALWIVFGGVVLLAPPQVVTGERFRVERSMQRRRLYAGIAIAVYLVGATLIQL